MYFTEWERLQILSVLSLRKAAVEELTLPYNTFNPEGFLATLISPRVLSGQNVQSFSRNAESPMRLLCLLLHGLEPGCPAIFLYVNTQLV